MLEDYPEKNQKKMYGSGGWGIVAGKVKVSVFALPTNVADLAIGLVSPVPGSTNSNTRHYFPRPNYRCHPQKASRTAVTESSKSGNSSVSKRTYTLVFPERTRPGPIVNEQAQHTFQRAINSGRGQKSRQSWRKLPSTNSEKRLWVRFMTRCVDQLLPKTRQTNKLRHVTQKHE